MKINYSKTKQQVFVPRECEFLVKGTRRDTTQPHRPQWGNSGSAGLCSGGSAVRAVFITIARNV
jgi:hypothetical protein